MPSFGDRLRQEREKRKITLEDISTSTKIGTRMLQALEEEKFAQLPGGIFNKGFVRAYARVVGLDEDQTVADYLEASGDAPPVKPETGSRENPRENTRESALREEENNNHLETRVEVTSRQLPWGIFAVVLLVIALALSLWSRRRHEQERLAEHPAPAVETSSPQVTPATSPGGPSVLPSPVSANINSSTTAASTLLNGKSSSAAAPPSQLNQATAPGPGEFTVVVKAREESWLSVSADGKSAGSELLAAGTERTFRGRREVTVKAGNAGGLDVLLNGKKLDIRADFGEVKTVTIGANGLMPNAAAQPPTQ